MRTLFILIIICAIVYFGFTIVKKDRVLGPRITDIADRAQEKLGLKEPMGSRSHCAINFIFPTEGDVITGSPITIEVVVDNSKEDCSWIVFEGQAGLVELYGEKGNLLYKTPLIADGEWMTSLPVTYSAELFYSTYVGPMKLVITEDNPSGEGTPEKVFIMIEAQ
jgi:hypothetical protein